MDELAAAASTDSLEFRLKHLADSRAKAVLERAAAMSQWQRPVQVNAGNGLLKGRGIGFAKYKNLAAYSSLMPASLTTLPQRAIS